jgi:peptide/nickel transport system ATP-binding protein
MFHGKGKLLLEALAIEKNYQKGNSQLKALNGVSLKLHRGEILALVGESGSGKTTLASILAGLLEADKGKLFIEEYQVPLKIRKAEMGAISYIFQDPYSSLSPHLSIFQTIVEPLIFMKNFRKKKDLYAIVCENLELVNLKPAKDFLHRYSHQLSGGQRQRVAFARALITEPKILIADEPTSMLDASISVGILNLLISQARKGMGIILITHNFLDANYAANRIAVIKNGTIVEEGDKEEIITNPQHPYTQLLCSSSF